MHWLTCSFSAEYFRSHYSNKISDGKQLTLSLDFAFLYASDKYDLSSQKKTLGKDDVGTSKRTLHARRKSFCKLDGSCWACSFGALLWNLLLTQCPVYMPVKIWHLANILHTACCWTNKWEKRSLSWLLYQGSNQLAHELKWSTYPEMQGKASQSAASLVKA